MNFLLFICKFLICLNVDLVTNKNIHYYFLNVDNKTVV